MNFVWHNKDRDVFNIYLLLAGLYVLGMLLYTVAKCK
jgi:hypothetical protein